MSEYSRDELDKARETLAELGVTNRFDANDAYILLSWFGRLFRYALIDHPANAHVRVGGAIYETWRELVDRSGAAHRVPEPVDEQRMLETPAVPALCLFTLDGVCFTHKGRHPDVSPMPTDDQLEQVITHLQEMV